MANTPGPSKSSNPSTGETPKKRTRRRNKHKPQEPKKQPREQPSPTSPVELKLQITRAKESSGQVFRKKQSPAPIQIQSFVKEQGVPWVFYSRISKNDAIADYGLISTLSQLTITPKPVSGRPTSKKLPIQAPPLQHKSSAKLRKEAEKRRKRNEKTKPDPFPPHFDQLDIEDGLKSKDFFTGNVRINAKNSKEAYVGNEDASKFDYMIESVKDRNRALEGDEVVLRLKQPTNNGPNSSGKYKLVEVLCITKQVHPRTCVGSLQPFSKDQAEFLPRDKRVPRIRIPKIGWPCGFQANPKFYEDALFMAKITGWDDVNFAVGTIVEDIGRRGNLKVESMAILKDNYLDVTPFADDMVKRYLPECISKPLTETEIASREDARNRCIFTIDPATARDLDDAVSVKRLISNNVITTDANFEVGVHISDASHYLMEGTPLDEVVKSKATTIYMVDEVFHMLPVELCHHCSLLPGKDKLAFSVFWEMTPDAEIVSHRIVKTVINSCAQMSYEHAQNMIDDPFWKPQGESEAFTIHNGYTLTDLSIRVNNLQNLAKKLREKRVKNGALRIDQVKIGFNLDPATGEPHEFWTCESKDSHKLIEEFMLLANMTVAEHIEKAYPNLALLRLHEPPKNTMLLELQRHLESIGIHVDISSSGGISASLLKYFGNDFLGMSRMYVLNHLFAKPMKRARYFCAGMEADTSHYALSVDKYTHFTSPIRRYADIIVHRLLAASLNYREVPNWSSKEVQLMAENCNVQKYNAKRAGEASTDLYLAHYVENHQPCIEKAVVFDTRERSIDVIVLTTGTVVRIYTNNFGDGVTYKAEQIRDKKPDDQKEQKPRWKILVTFPKTKTEAQSFMVLEMFSVVRVSLHRRANTHKLEGRLLRPLATISS